MLRHFTKGKDLIRLDVTQFAIAYLTLGCLNDCKIQLMTMFTSSNGGQVGIQKVKKGSRFCCDVAVAQINYPSLKHTR